MSFQAEKYEILVPSEVAADARSKCNFCLSLTLASVRTESEANTESVVCWTVNKDLHYFSVCVCSGRQSDVSHPSFSLLLSLSVWILISLRPSPLSCLIFSGFLQLNQPTNHHPTSSAIIDHSPLLLPLKMFC